MPRVELLCLANSRKNSNRCVAGLALDGSGWIRPVSSLPDGSLRPAQYLCEDGHKAAPLDVLSVDLAAPAPQPHQPENRRLGPGRWRHTRTLPDVAAMQFLERYLLTEPNLLGNGLDRVPYADLVERPGSVSLALVEPTRVRWQIASTAPTKRRVRAGFELSGVEYKLVVTDPEFEFALIRFADGHYDSAGIGITPDRRVMFTISLGEPFNGACYKLVAAVIVLARG